MGHSHNGSVAGRVAGGIKDGEPVRSVTGVASSALMVSDVPQAENEAFKKPPASVRAIGTVGFRSKFIFGNGKKRPIADISGVWHGHKDEHLRTSNAAHD